MSDYDGPRLQAWNLVNDERNRQETLRESGKFPWTLATVVTDDGASHPTDAGRFLVLAEEVGEVARALNELDYRAMMTEITHVAACAVAWLEHYSNDARGVGWTD